VKPSWEFARCPDHGGGQVPILWISVSAGNFSEQFFIIKIVDKIPLKRTGANPTPVSYNAWQRNQYISWCVFRIKKKSLM
jgi:hypothetical protein